MQFAAPPGTERRQQPAQPPQEAARVKRLLHSRPVRYNHFGCFSIAVQRAMKNSDNPVWQRGPHMCSRLKRGTMHEVMADLPVGGWAEVIGVHPHTTGRARRLPELPVVGDVDRALQSPDRMCQHAAVMTSGSLEYGISRACFRTLLHTYMRSLCLASRHCESTTWIVLSDWDRRWQELACVSVRPGMHVERGKANGQWVGTAPEL